MRKVGQLYTVKYRYPSFLLLEGVSSTTPNYEIFALSIRSSEKKENVKVIRG